MLADLLISILNYIILAIGTLIGTLVALLPDSPFIEILEEIHLPIQEYLSALNWLIPFDQIIIILGYWTMAITMYYIISIGLRWVKAIE